MFSEHWKVPWWSTAAFTVAQAFVSLRIVTPSDGTRIEPGEAVRTAEGASIALLGEPASALQTGDSVAAEVAVYRIVTEALTNVARTHSIALYASRAAPA